MLGVGRPASRGRHPTGSRITTNTTRDMTGNQTNASDGIELKLYEPWMAEQVAALFVAQYGGTLDEQRARYEAFYEAPFQRPHGIRIVAVDGETVCGFQSYFYWPYTLDGRSLRTFQSGNSLVSPAYRGKRIFARLLGYLSSAENPPEIDFLMGFPVEMSFGSFLRNGWDNPLDLSWLVRPIRPLSLLDDSMPPLDRWRFDRVPEPVWAVGPSDCLSLSRDEDFAEWRRSLLPPDGPHMYFHHRTDAGTVRFDLKANQRGRFKELIIGDVLRDTEDPALLDAAVRALVEAARGHRFLTMLSVALNIRCRDESLLRCLRRRGFWRIRRQIHFIVKPVRAIPEALDVTRWHLMSSDIDTWSS